MKLTKNELYRKPRWDITTKENVVVEEDRGGEKMRSPGATGVSVY